MSYDPPDILPAEINAIVEDRCLTPAEKAECMTVACAVSFGQAALKSTRSWRRYLESVEWRLSEEP